MQDASKLQELKGVGHKKAQMLLDALANGEEINRDLLISVKGISARMVEQWELQQYTSYEANAEVQVEAEANTDTDVDAEVQAGLFANLPPQLPKMTIEQLVAGIAAYEQSLLGGGDKGQVLGDLKGLQKSLVSVIKHAEAAGEAQCFTDLSYEHVAKLLISLVGAKAAESHKAYQSIHNISIRATSPNTLSVDATQRGEVVTGASVIQRLAPDTLSSVLALSVDVPKTMVTEVLTRVAQATRMLPISTSSGAMLLKFRNEDGGLTELAELFDGAFVNFSETTAYGLSMLNASVVEGLTPLGAHEPISGFDENGRPIKAIVFSAKQTGIICGTDGGGLNSLGSLGQFRAIGHGFFAKGLTVPALITIKDGRLYTPKDVELTEQELSYSWSDQEIIKVQRWREEFEADLSLPSLMAFESGQVKGRYKTTMEERFKSSRNGRFDIHQSVYGWLIIKCPKKSKTSLNFQPEALLRDLASTGVMTSEELTQTHQGWVERQKSHPEHDKLNYLMSHVFGKSVAIKFPGALLRSPEAQMWRRFTNGPFTEMPTRRLMMVDNKGREFTGLAVVDHDMVKRGATTACGWRGPLLVPQALAAPVLVSRKLCLQLISWLDKGKKKSKAMSKSYKLIKARLSFKQGKDFTDDEVRNVLIGIVEVVSLMPITEELVLLDCKDVEDCQGDDDGDTYVIDTNPKLVKQFVATEKWWVEFMARNSLQWPEIEQDKKLRVDYSRSVPDMLDLMGGKSPTEQFVDDCKLFGFSSPELCEFYGLTETGGKWLSPKGYSFGVFNDLIDLTKGEVWENAGILGGFISICSADPRGPVGPPSNIASDLIIKALAEVDSEGCLNEKGRKLWQAYLLMAYCVQTSIDWAKRAYDILNMALWSLTNDGEYVMDFSSKLTTENTAGLTVKDSFSHFHLATFTVGGEFYAVAILPDEDADNVDIIDILENAVSEDRILRGAFVADKEQLKLASEQISFEIKEIQLMDPQTGCFDFNCIYAIASHMLNKKDTCVWKVPPSTWSENAMEIMEDLAHSDQSSSLVHNGLNFLEFICSSEDAKTLISYPSKIVKSLGDAPSTTDSMWLKVSAVLQKFFSEQGSKFGGPPPSKAEMIRVLYSGFGIESREQIVALKRGGSIDIDGVPITLIDILRTLIKNDLSWTNADIPQCSWQMIIADYLEPEEEPELKVRLENFVQAYYEACLDKARKSEARPQSLIDTPRLLMEEEPELLDLWHDFVELNEYGSYRWASHEARFDAILVWIERFKKDCVMKLMRSTSLKEVLISYLKEQSRLPEAYLDFLSFMKSALRPFDKLLRIMKAHDLDTEYVASYWSINNRKKNCWRRFDEEDVVNGMTIHQLVHPMNLFAADLDETRWLQKLFYYNRVVPTQWSRSAQWELITGLTGDGYLVSSYSFFGRTNYVDYSTVVLMEAIANGQAHIHENGKVVKGTYGTTRNQGLNICVRQIVDLSKYSGRLHGSGGFELPAYLNGLIDSRAISNGRITYLRNGFTTEVRKIEALRALNSDKSPREKATWMIISGIAKAVKAFRENQVAGIVWLDGQKFDLSAEESRLRFRSLFMKLLSYWL